MTIIDSKAGRFSGIDVGDNIMQFLGIQYATADRFREPQDIISYAAQVDAVSFGAQSPQVPGFMDEILGTKTIPVDEQCLYLNIWAPKKPNKSLPVLFWIHGGAFTNGTAATSWYDGKNLVSLGEVVLVSINYRLGPFGFIGTRSFGLLDQISALRWVNRNISAFGGDPANVTVFGESAGGSSVVALTASQGSRGLFKQAWAMSPSLLQLRTKREAEIATQQFLAAASCSTIDELELLPCQDVLAATAKMFAEVENYISTFTPTCGGEDLPEDVFSASASSGIPMVIGTNRDENRLWVALNPQSGQMAIDAAKNIFQKTFGNRADEAWQTYSRLRPNHSPAQMIAAMQTDQNFRFPAWRLAERRSRETETWMYWFTWPTPVFDGALGCCHALDLPFMFGNLQAPSVEMFTGGDPTRKQISQIFTAELFEFARTGRVSWPAFDDENRETLQISTERSSVSDPEPEIRRLWAATL
ncbi:MAG: carboxylesterase/lipase family protein [Actinomycetota bacterium]